MDPFLTVRVACVGLVQLENRGGLQARVPAALQEAEALVDAFLDQCIAAVGATPLAAHVRGTLIGFESPTDAVQLAMRLQRGLLDLNWPSTLLQRPELSDVQGPEGQVLFRGLRLRVALVKGPVWMAGDHVLGPAVHRVARVVNLAHGGQTLLTEEVYAGLDPALAAFTDLGALPLIGEAGRHRVTSATPQDLAAREFPPPRTLRQRGGNLREDQGFVGRQQDVAALNELANLGVRIVSIEGPPGIGKSNLCRQYARLRQNQAGPSGGVCWAGPAVQDLESLIDNLARILGIGLQYTADVSAAVRQVGRSLASRGPLLLALDLDVATDAIREAIEHWTTMAPEASFVVATPARLKAKGEVAYQLGPLGLPSDAEATRDADAVRLFAHRAQNAGASLAAPDDPALVEAIERLEGNPRQIRLLAGMLERCSPDEVVATGTTGSFDALIEAAWEALTESEQTLLQSCAVLEGSFDVETLAVAGRPTVVGGLRQLERLGFLDRVIVGGAPDLLRYSLGPDICDWVEREQQRTGISATPADSDAETAPRLLVVGSQPEADVGESTTVPAVFGEAEALSSHIDASTAAWVLEHWAAWRATIDQALANDEASELDRAMAYWSDHQALGQWGPLFETLPITLRLLGRAEQVTGVDVARVAALWLVSAQLHLQAGSPAVSDTDLERAGALLEHVEVPELDRAFAEWSAIVARSRGVASVAENAPSQRVGIAHAALDALQRGDDDEAIGALTGLVDPPTADRQAVDWAMALVWALRRTGRSDDAYALGMNWAEAVAPLGDARAEARIAERVGWVDYHVGRLEDADRTWTQALGQARRAGDRWAEGLLLGPAGLVALSRGDLETCRTRLLAALAIHREGGDSLREGQVTGMLGILDHVSHQPQSARENYRRAVDLLGNHGPHRDGAMFGAFGAALEAELGHLDSAEQQWADAEAQQATLRDPDVEAAMDQLRLALWWVRAQSFELAGDSARAATLMGQARDRITASLERETPLPGEARLALARMDRLFGR